MTWFQNIGLWFAQNKDAIVAFMTSGTFISLVGAIVLFIRQWRAVKTNNTSVQNLTGKVEGLDEAIKAVNEMTESVQNLMSQLYELKAEYSELQGDNEELNNKLDSIIEAMSIAWGTLRDDTTRNNVINVLTAAKISTEAKKAELVDKLQELERKIAENVKKTNDTVKEVVTETKKIVNEKKPTRN